MLNFNVDWNTWSDFREWWNSSKDFIDEGNYYDVCNLIGSHNMKALFRKELYGSRIDFQLSDFITMNMKYKPIQEMVRSHIEQFNPRSHHKDIVIPWLALHGSYI